MLYVCETENKKCLLANSFGNCLYENGCSDVVEECNGCSRILENNKCKAFSNPAARWKNGECPLATHLTEKIEETKKKVNPIKKSKRKSG